MSITEPLLKLAYLQQLQGKNAKQSYLERQADDEQFKNLLRYRFHPFYAYGIKQIDIPHSQDESLTYEEFIQLLDKLRSNPINDKLRREAEQVLSRGPNKLIHVLKGILLKDLSLGVDTTILKVYPKLYPTFDIMLAEPYEGLAFPVQAEEKYDGVRCSALVYRDRAELYTRTGNRLSFPPLEKELLKLANGAELMFDGELTHINRTKISGMCNSNLKKGYVQGSEVGLTYQLFDMLPLNVFQFKLKSDPLKQRSIDLERLCLQTTGLKHIAKGRTAILRSMAEAKQLFNTVLQNGGEGLILKDRDASYEFRRSKAWQKIKAINDCTLEIVGVTEGEGKRKGKIGALVCQSKCGLLKVDVGTGLTDYQIDLFTQVSPVGKFVEVIFNVLLNPSDGKWSLFLPRFGSIRIDKTEADTLDKIKAEHVGNIEFGHRESRV